VHGPEVCVKPEPEKVIVAPTEPEVGVNAIEGPMTVNDCETAGDPVVSVKVMK